MSTEKQKFGKSLSRQKGLKAQKILTDFVNQEDLGEISETLDTFFYEWVQSEETFAYKTRATFLAHYLLLKDFLSVAGNFEKQL